MKTFAHGSQGNGMKTLSLLLAATLAALFSAGAAMAQTRTLKGTVAYRERMALPPNALVEVKLVDVSLADAPSPVIAQTSIETRGRQPPIPFVLQYDAGAIVKRRRYALQARITVDGAPWFVTTTAHPVFSGRRNRADLLLQRASAASAAPAPAAVAQAAPTTPAGRWLAESVEGRGVIDRLQTTLEIAADGTVSGSGGCNRFGGKATIDGERIDLGRLFSTQMACPPAAMDQERRFLDALAKVKRWRVDPAQRKLLLVDEAGRTLVTLSAM